jgi:hypothetical protein
MDLDRDDLVTGMDEQEAYAIRHRAAAAIASVDEMNQRLAERAAGGAGTGEGEWRARQQPEPVSAPQRARERPVDGWQRRVERIADAKLTAFEARFVDGIGGALAGERTLWREAIAEVAEIIGDESGRMRQEDRELLRAEFKAALAELRAELTAAAQPGKPRLIGGSDAAA